MTLQIKLRQERQHSLDFLRECKLEESWCVIFFKLCTLQNESIIRTRIRVLTDGLPSGCWIDQTVAKTNGMWVTIRLEESWKVMWAQLNKKILTQSTIFAKRMPIVISNNRWWLGRNLVILVKSARNLTTINHGELMITGRNIKRVFVITKYAICVQSPPLVSIGFKGWVTL